MLWARLLLHAKVLVGGLTFAAALVLVLRANRGAGGPARLATLPVPGQGAGEAEGEEEELGPSGAEERRPII